MERLTTNKNVPNMSMIELAYNSCYVDDEHNARYRDYDLDIDGRQLVKSLAKDICNEDLTDLSDEEFDEYMASMLSAGIDSTIGLLALFYRNLWAMADLRTRLKSYEDAEEQGLLLRLPCKIGDTVYETYRDGEYCSSWWDIRQRKFTLAFYEKHLNDFHKTVFLTQEEAEARLKDMEDSDGR